MDGEEEREMDEVLREEESLGKVGGQIQFSYWKHKIVFMDSMVLDIGSGTRERVMSKKKGITTRNLEDWTKFTIQTRKSVPSDRTNRSYLNPLTDSRVSPPW